MLTTQPTSLPSLPSFPASSESFLLSLVSQRSRSSSRRLGRWVRILADEHAADVTPLALEDLNFGRESAQGADEDAAGQDLVLALVEVDCEVLDAVMLLGKSAGDEPPVEGSVARVARVVDGAEELG